jgi:hypothetical protein
MKYKGFDVELVVRVQKYLHDKAECHSACCYYCALEDLDEVTDDQARNEEEPE